MRSLVSALLGRPAATPASTDAELRAVLEQTQAELATLKARLEASRVVELELQVEALTVELAEATARGDDLLLRLDELKADAEAEVEQRLDALELGQERSARQLERADVVRSDLFHQLKTARAEARVLEGENERLRHLLDNASAERPLQGRSLRGKVKSFFGR